MLVGMSSYAQEHILLQQDFEGGVDAVSDWRVIDHDLDGNTWGVTQFQTAGGSPIGTIVACSFSYSNDTGKALTPDNWLVTPIVTLGPGAKLVFDASGVDPSYPSEVMGVFVTEQTGFTEFDVTDWEQVFKATSTEDWTTYEVDLSAYEGKTVLLAFRHWDCTDQYALQIDNILLTDMGGSSAINDVKVNATDATDGYYDMQGRRYSEQPTAPGIYILGGKKLIVK